MNTTARDPARECQPKSWHHWKRCTGIAMAFDGLWPLLVIGGIGLLVWFAYPFICWSLCK